jgi:hypothetical protein
MRQKSVTGSSPSERLVKTIRRATRKQYSAEEKIRIVLDGLRGESVGIGVGRASDLQFPVDRSTLPRATKRSCAICTTRCARDFIARFQ